MSKTGDLRAAVRIEQYLFRKRGADSDRISIGTRNRSDIEAEKQDCLPHLVRGKKREAEFG
jgi:hypothetical protein